MLCLDLGERGIASEGKAKVWGWGSVAPAGEQQVYSSSWALIVQVNRGLFAVVGLYIAGQLKANPLPREELVEIARLGAWVSCRLPIGGSARLSR